MYWVNAPHTPVEAIHSMKDPISLLQNGSYSHVFFQIYYAFSEGLLQQKHIIVSNLVMNYDIYLVVGIYLLED